VLDADHVRLERIAGKLAEARASAVVLTAFGVTHHKFELNAPAPEVTVAKFEERHEIVLPPPYRMFVTELGNGGAGPGYRMRRLVDSCGAGQCRRGHLAEPSPYLPGPRYFGDWEQRYEDPPGADRNFLRGTLRIADHGCSLFTQLIVTGPARGRLFNLDGEGPVGPYVVEDADFLAWYERWLDEAVAGYDVGWFGERLPLHEPELIAALIDDPSPQRRARAGESLLQLPVVTDVAWTALVQTLATDEEPAVRAQLWHLLRWQTRDRRRRLDNAVTIAEGVAQHARTQTPPDLGALAVLRRLTFADVMPELVNQDLERRRRAAYALAWERWEIKAEGVEQRVIENVAGMLLDDSDALVRSHGVAVVHWYNLARLLPLLRERQRAETDPWVQDWLSWCLSPLTIARSAGSDTEFTTDVPPF
jgi:hypothetical protein